MPGGPEELEEILYWKERAEALALVAWTPLVLVRQSGLITGERVLSPANDSNLGVLLFWD